MDTSKKRGATYEHLVGEQRTIPFRPPQARERSWSLTSGSILPGRMRSTSVLSSADGKPESYILDTLSIPKDLRPFFYTVRDVVWVNYSDVIRHVICHPFLRKRENAPETETKEKFEVVVYLDKMLLSKSKEFNILPYLKMIHAFDSVTFVLASYCHDRATTLMNVTNNIMNTKDWRKIVSSANCLEAVIVWFEERLVEITLKSTSKLAKNILITNKSEEIEEILQTLGLSIRASQAPKGWIGMMAVNSVE